MKHALRPVSPGRDGRLWPVLPGDREPSPTTWVVIVDGPRKSKSAGRRLPRRGGRSGGAR